MAAVVADTHAAAWYIGAPLRLSKVALDALDACALISEPIILPSISLVELQYLVDKKRITQTVLDRINQALDDPTHALSLFPLDASVARLIGQIPRVTIPDMPDRIIAATALHLNQPLVSRDRKIQASNLTTIW